MALSADRPRRRMPERAVFLVLIVVLVIANLVAHVARSPISDVVVPLAAIVLVVLVRWAGMSWAELGLARADWRRGARWAVVLASVTFGVLAVGVALPATRSNFLTERYDIGLGPAVLAAFVLIPLLTAIPEELAFRGVLYGYIDRRHGPKAATIGSSALFGLWHVTSSLGLTAANLQVGSALGHGVVGQALGVLGAVLFTAAAGVVFCWLRRRSGSLLAPIGLHWAVDGAGALAAAFAWHLGT